MNLSTKWLKEFVDIDVEPREFCEALTMSGSKVEGYDIEGSELSNIVVCIILNIEKHPEADKLFVCKVDIGKDEPIQIVTNATNINVGDLVPVALDKSTLHGGGKITKGKLRGVLSEGMFCSVAELGVTVGDFPYAEDDKVMILNCDENSDIKVGQDIKEALGINDTVYEFEITSNRPDCLSVIGLARETAITFGKELKLHTPQVKGCGGDINDEISVTVHDSKLCKRYMAKMVKNIRVKPSPRWMRERLRASGVRPINNIVDITNYVMLEYGQPMHAFDSRFVGGGKINVRTAKEGEIIKTLDDTDRKLTEKMLVIADENVPMAVAGVMGGENSGIVDDTSTVIFESACFDGASVRTTARDLAMRTDSSARFEKGLDPENCYGALLRACELVELIDAGDVVDGIIDCYPVKNERKKIKFEPEWTNKFLGTDLDPEYMLDILKKLDVEVEGDYLYPPTYRADLEHKADIAEEIARFYGYNKIDTTPLFGLAEGYLTEEQKFENDIKSILTSIGYYEIITYSFISPKFYNKAGFDAEKEIANSVVISNPLGEDTSIMRTTALPSMLDTLARNYNNRNLSAKLFEIATEYKSQGKDVLPIESKKIVIGQYAEDCDFYKIKATVETLLKYFVKAEYDISAVTDNPTYHPGQTAEYKIGDDLLCTVGQIHPNVAKNFNIGAKVFTAVIDLPILFKYTDMEKSYTPLPKYPAIERDLALLCDIDTAVLSLQKAIKSASSIIRDVRLFDVYTGKQIESGKKSVAFNIILRSDDKTLTDEDCDSAMKKVFKALENLGAKLRL
jgi:phenylalanyl-tRNA synthetase beta chain